MECFGTKRQGRRHDSIYKNITEIGSNPNEEWDLITKRKLYFKHFFSLALYKLQQIKGKDKRRLKGSIVVEAAVALPVFLLAISHLIYWMSFLDTERQLSAKVNEKARQIATLSFVEEDSNQELIEIKKGTILRGEYFSKIARARPFTGRYYDSSVLSEEESKLVFVTKNGEVYHRSLVCSHIKPSIMVIQAAVVKNKRNKKGEKYYACEFCGQKKETALYITPYGNRYHTDKRCKGLRRTIRIINLKMARGFGFRRCKKCGGYSD